MIMTVWSSQVSERKLTHTLFDNIFNWRNNYLIIQHLIDLDQIDNTPASLFSCLT